jgi:hypothetical protein
MMLASVVLPNPGGPCQQNVVERLATIARGLDEDTQVLGRTPLPDVFGEARRAQR